MPAKRGPHGAHKLDARVMHLVMTAIDDDPTLKPAALVHLIQQAFQITVHPRTIEKALARKKNSAANGRPQGGDVCLRQP